MLLMSSGRQVAFGVPDRMMNQTLLTRVYGDVVDVVETGRGPVVMAN
jgi:ABC-type hemin transport system ATPase subunit